MQRFIVKITYGSGDTYWRGEGEGLTDEKSRAYRYTRQQLEEHQYKGELKNDPFGGRVVLIPVKD